MEVRIKILLLKILFFPFLVFSQEDSTVYLKPIFKKGDLLNYTYTEELKKTIGDSTVLVENKYSYGIELLKSAYGLSVLKSEYGLNQNVHVLPSYSKNSLDVYFTIDSNTRFVAIENSRQIYKVFSENKNGTQIPKFDSIYLESLFPELELLFFLNGAKYVMGEVYRSETVIQTNYIEIPCFIDVELKNYNRSLNQFDISCKIQPKSDFNGRFQYHLKYSFYLNDLKVKTVQSDQLYEIGDFQFHQKIQIKDNRIEEN